MLSVNQLNENKKKVNQHLTKHGIKKPAIPQIVEAIAMTLNPKAYVAEDSTIDDQIEVMNREKVEKKLLQYQLANNPQNVSAFLQNKYADGSFNVGIVDRYDNSVERLQNGITFDYHVYFPKRKTVNESLRGRNKYVLSEVLQDKKTGDSYTYHIPVWLDEENGVPYYITDFGERVDRTGAKGLLWALTELHRAISSGQFYVPAEAQAILEAFGFLEDGKINLAIKRGVMVEKYLKGVKNETKEKEVVEYLEDMLTKDEQHRSTTGDGRALEDAVSKLTADDISKLGDDDIPKLGDDTLLGDEDGDDVDSPETTSKDLIPISSTTGTSMKDLLRENNIPVYLYEQLSSSTTRQLKESAALYVPLLGQEKGRFVKIMFRSGTKKTKIDELERLAREYNNAVMSTKYSGALQVVPLNEKLQSLLRFKGFSALITHAKPRDLITGFTAVRDAN